MCGSVEQQHNRVIQQTGSWDTGRWSTPVSMQVGLSMVALSLCVIRLDINDLQQM